MRTHEDGADLGWKDIGYDVLYRVSVDGRNTNGGCPFMVLLVDVLIDTRMME